MERQKLIDSISVSWPDEDVARDVGGGHDCLPWLDRGAAGDAAIAVGELHLRSFSFFPFSCWSRLLPPWREWRQMTGDVSTLFWKQLFILTHVYYSVDRIQSHFICHKMFYVISHKAHWHFIIIEDYCKWIKEAVGRLWLPLALLVLKWKYSTSTQLKFTPVHFITFL